MIYLYALAEHAPALAGASSRPGIEDAPLLLRPYDGLVAACSTHARPTIPITAENVWRHEQVIERLMADVTVLPARFGTCFDHENRLHDTLARHRDRLHQGLDRLRGCLEMGVRILWDPPAASPDEPIPQPRTGRDYLLHRAAQEHQRRNLHDQAARRATPVHENLSLHAADSTMHLLPTPQVLMSAAYLIARPQCEHFRRCVQQAVADHPDLKILGTGPWPPYHFTPSLK